MYHTKSNITSESFQRKYLTHIPIQKTIIEKRLKMYIFKLHFAKTYFNRPIKFVQTSHYFIQFCFFCLFLNLITRISSVKLPQEVIFGFKRVFSTNTHLASKFVACSVGTSFNIHITNLRSRGEPCNIHGPEDYWNGMINKSKRKVEAVFNPFVSSALFL